MASSGRMTRTATEMLSSCDPRENGTVLVRWWMTFSVLFLFINVRNINEMFRAENNVFTSS